LAKLQSISRSIKVALLGADTLLGRELQDVFEREIDRVRINPYSANGEGSIGEQEGEAVYLDALDAKTTKEDDFILLAGSAEGAQKAYELATAARGRLRIVDCNGQLEQQPEAHTVSPLLDDREARPKWLLVIAHPVAVALTLALRRLARYRAINRSVANIFEPASERGKAGALELQQQTSSLLAFKSLDKNVFDTQLSFNLLPQYGSEAPVPLSSVEQRIERHMATLLASAADAPPMPSLRVLQAPVFHGYSISLWVEFVANVSAVEIAEALACAQIEVRGSADEPPSNVGVAGQSGILAGDIRLDHNNGRAVWIWLVCDNLRAVADSAVALVKALNSPVQ
jgi:aspartate-semialdehyde dehydrogenase